ncbi:MAG: ATP-binding protein [Oscillospiraceae bacterium]|jgi:DNA replication protein DnaC|nr:ATP-binding protein [Oscillospiraceae bacterium]
MGVEVGALEKALSEVLAGRLRAVEEAEKRKRQLFEKCPELALLEAEIARAGLDAVRAVLSGEPEENMKAAGAKSLAAQNRRCDILEKLGYSPGVFLPVYACGLCQDTGFSGGKLCRCVKEKVKRDEFRELCLKAPLKESNFDRFSLEYYDGDARQTMQKVYGYCREYAARFGQETKNLLLTGRTGLGKTHLSLAIAAEVINKGYSVIYGSALDLLHKAEREHFGREQGTDVMASLCGADLLILDDLGAEYSSPFTVSAVYHIINTRLLQKKPMVISTNLIPAELERRYGERVVSRFISEYTPLSFAGTDVRQKKALENKLRIDGYAVAFSDGIKKFPQDHRNNCQMD